MNRALMRTMLRRRVDDVEEEVWADSDLDQILIVATQLMETHVLEIDAEAFIQIDTAHIVSGQKEYEKPAGMLHEIALLKLGSDGVTYTRIRRLDYNQILEREADGGSSSETVYAHMGRYLVLSPTPSASVTAGLRAVYVPSLTLAEDTDIPPMPLPLHIGVVMEADLLLQGETGEGAEGKDAKTSKDLANIKNSIPKYYRKSVADEQRVRLDGSVKGY
jgi:hypothetical protein